MGALATWDDKILILCKRAIEPRYGCWTLPAGFMENNETCGEAAVRETAEEAGARIALGPMFTFVDLPHISQIHHLPCRLLDLDFQPGEESLEATLMGEESRSRGTNIAFRSVSYTPRPFEDRRRGLLIFIPRASASRCLTPTDKTLLATCLPGRFTADGLSK